MLIPVGGGAYAGSGGSIAFSSGDVLASTTSIADVGTGQVTWEAWIKPDALASSAQAVMGVGTATTAYMGFSRASGFDFFPSGFWATSSSAAGVSGTLSAGNWHHIAFVRNGTSFLRFRDGALVQSSVNASHAVAIATGPLHLASSASDVSASPFAGKIALARFSSTARYTTTFTPDQDYGVDANTEALIGSFDGGSTISDATGNYALTSVAGSPAADAEGVF